MMKISPKRIKGKWTCGYSLDLHTLSSEFIGYNEYGHPQFDTKYSDMGGSWSVDLIIPVPPSRETRAFQPVIAVAKGVSKFTGIKLCTDCVVKIKKTPELKDIYEFNKRVEILKDAYAVAKREVEGRNILLFDDLYRSGATLNAITQALKDKGKAKEVYALTLTITRRRR